MCFFFSSRRRHTRWPRDWSSDVCSSDVGGGEGALGGRAQVGIFAPSGNDQATEVEVEQPVGDGGDLVVGCVPAGPRQLGDALAEGAQHALLVEGVGERVDAVFFGVAEQEGGGGERLGGDGGGHQSPSFRVWVPASPCGCSRTLKVGAD